MDLTFQFPSKPKYSTKHTHERERERVIVAPGGRQVHNKGRRRWRGLAFHSMHNFSCISAYKIKIKALVCHSDQ